MASNTPDQCGFCQSIESEMVTPRKLPCNHVFCTQCLKDNQTCTGEENSVKCPMCRTFCRLPTGGWSSLPILKYNSTRVDNSLIELMQPGSIKCSVCDEESGARPAIVYCPDCDNPLCVEDQKMHEKIHRKHPDHQKLISIAVYTERRAKFAKKVCSTHGNTLEYHCSVCGVKACQRCATTDKGKCHSPNESHNFIHLDDIEKDITAAFSELTRKASSRQQDLRTAQKAVYQQIADLDEKYETKKAELATAQEQQLKELNSMWTQLKGKMDQKYNEGKAKLVLHDEQVLEATIEHITKLTAKVGSSLRQKHIIDLIDNREDLVSEVTNTLEIDCSPPLVSLPAVVLKTDYCPQLNVEMKQIISIGAISGAKPVRIRKAEQTHHSSMVTQPQVLNGPADILIFPGGLKVCVYKQSIITAQVDAIASAADTYLDHIGGIARAIAEACGRKFREEGKNHIRKTRPLQSTETFPQRAQGKLKDSGIKHVINAVGVVMDWRNVERCITGLAQTIVNVLDCAERLECSTVAIPAIGSGISGIPMDTCTAAYYEALLSFTSDQKAKCLREVHFVNIDDATTDRINGDFSKYHKDSVAYWSDNFSLTLDPPFAPHSGMSGAESSWPQKVLGKLRLEVTSQVQGQTLVGKSTDDGCSICMDVMKDPRTIRCGHSFCSACLDQYEKNSSKLCPICRKVYGRLKGDQPKGGYMAHTVDSFSSLDGHPQCGTIIITYTIPSGTQEACHPNPGNIYDGIQRTAYLPNNGRGVKVLAMLKKAFEARLVFTIGHSHTTGADGVITWNDIHHKTNRSGGPQRFGYPDMTYLDRVEDELKAKGITP